jgi:hypothetical protein
MDIWIKKGGATSDRSRIPARGPLFEPYVLPCTNRACCQSHPVKMFIKATMPRDKRNQVLICFLGRLMKYLVVCNFGCLIQSLYCLQLLNAIQCLECASMTHLLLISRTSSRTVEHKAPVHKSVIPSPSAPVSSLPLMSQ